MTGAPPPVCLRGHLMRRNPRVKKMDVWTCPEGCEYAINTEPGFYRDPEAEPVEQACAAGCGRTFLPSLRHSYQQFCSVACRMKVYRRRRKEAAE